MFAHFKTAAACIVTILSSCGSMWAEESACKRSEQISVVVGGEVKSKGRYTLNKGATLLDAVEAAGGLTMYAPIELRLIHNARVTVIDTRKLRDENSKGPVLEDGDQVQAPQTYF